MSEFISCDPRKLRVRLESARLVCQQAIHHLFPRFKPIRSGINGPLFFVDCLAPESVSPDMLKRIQEKVALDVGANIPISKVEMVRSNVIDFLKSQGAKERASWFAAGVSEGVVPLLKLGSHVQEFFEAIPKSSKEAEEVVLLHAEPFSLYLEGRSSPAVRIFGSAFSDKEGAKRYKKAFKEVLKGSKGKEGLVAPLEDEGECNLAWLPKGLTKRESLLKNYREDVEKLGYKQVSTPIVAPIRARPDAALGLPTQLLWHLQLYRSLPFSGGQWRSYEVSASYAEVPLSDLLDPFSTTWPTHDLNFAFMDEPLLEKELISSLQFMGRTFKMLKVKCEWHVPKSQATSLLPNREWIRLNRLLEKALDEVEIVPVDSSYEALTPQIEGRFVDELGRRWPGPTLSLITGPLVERLEGSRSEKKGALLGLYWTQFRSLERWIPLLEEIVEGI